MSINPIEVVPFSTLQKLEAQGGHGFHGSPIAPDFLDVHKNVEPQSLVPLHTPRNRDPQTGLHLPRDPRRIAIVSFFDMLAPATARALFHADNHPTLAPVDCLSGYHLDADGGLHIDATQALLDEFDTKFDSETAAWVYSAPLDGTTRSPHDAHDHWSEDPVRPEMAARVDGSFVRGYLAQMSVAGTVEIVPPFIPGYNNC